MLYKGLKLEKKPDAIHRLNATTILFNFNIVEKQDQENGQTSLFFEYDSLVVEHDRLTPNSIFAAWIQSEYPKDLEAKLQNDYNAAKEGIFHAGKTTQGQQQPYIDFLQKKEEMRILIDQICQANGIS